MPEVIEAALWKRNRKTVTKNCLNCGKEFTTDTPWQKHCSYRPCAYDYMRRLQQTRREATRERDKGTVKCTGCQQGVTDVAVYLNARQSKGVCYGCMNKIEALKWDKSYAYRLAYIMQVMSRPVRDA